MVMKVQTYDRGQIVRDTKLGLADSGKDLEQSNIGAIKEHRAVINNILIENDKARTRSVYNDFREASRSKLVELQNDKGATAIGKNSVSKRYREWYEEEVSELSDGLDNVDQQQGFKIMSNQRKDSDLDSLASYEASQHKTHMLGVHKGEIANAQADVMTFYADDSKMEDIELGVKASFQSTFRGLDTTEAEQKELAGLYALRIKMLSDNGMTEKANELLEKHKDTLKGAYFTLKTNVDSADLRVSSQAATDEIMANKTGEAAQLAEARRRYEGEMEDEVVRRIKVRQNDIKRAAQDMKKQEMNDKIGQALDIHSNKGSEKDFRAVFEKSQNPEIRLKGEQLARIYYPDPSKVKITPEQKGASALNYATAQRAIDQAINNKKPFTDAEVISKFGSHILESEHDNLLKYNKDAQKNNVKTSISTQKARIEKMYGSNVFGKDKKKAAAIKNNVLLGLHEWIDENPGKDPSEYVDLKLELVAAEVMADGLNSFWNLENFIPGPDTDEIKKEIASGDIDRDLVEDLAREMGINISKMTDEHYQKVMKTEEFMKYKTDLLEGRRERVENRQTTEDDDTVLHPINDTREGNVE